MANYQGKGRSGFVKVTDKAKVIKIASLYKLKYEVISGDRIGFFSTNEEGEAETIIYPDDEANVALAVELDIIVESKNVSEYELPDFTDTIADYLCDGEVFIWKHSGSMKYEISAYSLAINNKKQKKYVSIDDIFDAKELGTIVNF